MPLTETGNFSREELGCRLHPFLLVFLQELRQVTQMCIDITSTIRTFEEHVAIYKKNYPDNWQDKITLRSAHLPQVLENGEISPYCHAVDFSIRGIEDHKTEEFLFRPIIEKGINMLFPKESQAYGLGIAKDFIHLDCAPHRTSMAKWGY